MRRKSLRPRKKHDTKDMYPRIDLNVLWRNGLFKKGSGVLVLSWHGTGVLAVVSKTYARKKGTLHIVIQADGAEPFKFSMPCSRIKTPKTKFNNFVWFAECPECSKRSSFHYIKAAESRVACAKCLKLISRQSQKHDKRADLARSDPDTFVSTRKHMTSERSEYTTAKYLLKAMLRPPLKRNSWRQKEDVDDRS